jgi:asparagine N-glycosylation enzyme membrane subunit Stt3
VRARPRWASYLGIASFLALLPLAAAGGIWLRRRRVRIWLLFTLVWVVLISAAVFYGTPRFRVPAEPTVVVLAAVGIGALLGRRWPGMGPEPPPEAQRPTVATAATAER